MKLTAPDYYREFHCLASKCRHNCCAGWEIDIDSSTLAFYRRQKGIFGKRLSEAIEEGEDSACFRLIGEEERCPFLNRENLCDIIIELGKEHLCQICGDHPRFRSFFSDRTELGLGLCCEAAARLILGKRERVCLTVLEEDGKEKIFKKKETSLLLARAKAISILQNRSVPVKSRAEQLLNTFGKAEKQKSVAEWSEVFRGLERMSTEWDRCIEALSQFEEPENTQLDELFQIPFEQLLVYFVYRHFPSAQREKDFLSRAAFAVLGFRILRALCLLHPEKAGRCSIEDFAEYSRHYSAEIEYSDKNTEALFALLTPGENREPFLK